MIGMHCHTIGSDGSDNYLGIFDQAKREKVQAIVITDHDNPFTPDRWSYIKSLAHAFKIETLSGVEVSSIHRRKSIHILGYGYQPTKAEKILQQLTPNWQALDDWTAQFLQMLYRKNLLDETADYLLHLCKLNAPCLFPLPVMHFAARLNDCTLAEIRSAVFNGDNPFDLLADLGMLSSQEAIDWIHQAGGKAVIAHPKLILERSSNDCQSDLNSILEELVEMGADGIEAHYPMHDRSETLRFLNFAEKHQLQVTAGNDYHGCYNSFSIGTPAMTLAEFRKFKNFCH